MQSRGPYGAIALLFAENNGNAFQNGRVILFFEMLKNTKNLLKAEWALEDPGSISWSLFHLGCLFLTEVIPNLISFGGFRFLFRLGRIQMGKDGFIVLCYRNKRYLPNLKLVHLRFEEDYQKQCVSENAITIRGRTPIPLDVLSAPPFGPLG